MTESFTEILRILGERYRAYRITSRMTQKDVSNSSGVSITTIHNFESGKMQSIDARVLFVLLKTIGLSNTFLDLIPDLTESPYIYSSRDISKHKRVRK